MQPMNPESMERTVAMRHRTLLIIWFAQLMTIIMFALITILVRNDRKVQPSSDSNITIVFMAMAALMILASLVLRSKLAAVAVEQRSLQKLQVAYVVAYALCEAAAVFGLLDFFISGDPYYYLILLIGAVGLLLHLPKRDAILSAMPGNRI